MLERGRIIAKPRDTLIPDYFYLAIYPLLKKMKAPLEFFLFSDYELAFKILHIKGWLDIDILADRIKQPKYTRFRSNSSTKISRKILNFVYFCHFSTHFQTKMIIKSLICKIAQIYSLTVFPHVLWSSGENFSHFEPKL